MNGRVGLRRTALGLLFLAGGCRFSHVYRFPGISGPNPVTVVPPPEAASWENEHRGTESRLAILLTDPDSNWLGLVHGLKTIGVPITVARSVSEAVRHSVVLVYPIISGHVLKPEELRLLAALPRRGGTLIGINVLGGLQDVFGFKEAVPSRDRLEMRLDARQTLATPFHDPRELTLPLGAAGNAERLGTYGYTRAQELPLAAYPDGSAAITQKSYGHGHAYAFGVDLGQLLLVGYNNRDDTLERSYVNQYEPLLDVFLRLLRSMYIAGESSAVTLGTVPEGRPLAVVITHDIDFTRSVENCAAYADFETAQGFHATYFLQTKYIRDYNDDSFFNAREVPVLKKLIAQGMEIGSHSIAHSKVFDHFALGSGTERYPAYQPFVQSALVTTGGTILGELRVSKFLIETLIGGPKTQSFRPGHLANPYQLPQALEATGYKYSSSVTANNSLTHLPFQLNYDRDYTAETDIYEFPITIEDEEPPLMVERLPQALALARKLSVYGGTFVILIHPNIVGQKFDFEKGFVQAMKGKAWLGPLAELGRWWAARDHVGVDVRRHGREAVVSLSVPEAMDSLPLEIPAGWQVIKISPAGTSSEIVGGQLVLHPVARDILLTFRTPRS